MNNINTNKVKPVLTKTQIQRMVELTIDGFSKVSIATSLGITVDVLNTYDNAMTGYINQHVYMKVQAAKESAGRAEQAKYKHLVKHKGDYYELTQDMYNHIIKAVLDDAALGNYDAATTYISTIGVPDKHVKAVSTRVNPKMNRDAWVANTGHSEVVAAKSVGFMNGNDKADATCSSISHMVNSLQGTHKRLRSHLEMQTEMIDMKKRIAELEANRLKADTAIVLLEDGKDWRQVAIELKAANPELGYQRIANEVGKSKSAVAKLLRGNK